MGERKYDLGETKHAVINGYSYAIQIVNKNTLRVFGVKGMHHIKEVVERGQDVPISMEGFNRVVRFHEIVMVTKTWLNVRLEVRDSSHKLATIMTEAEWVEPIELTKANTLLKAIHSEMDGSAWSNKTLGVTSDTWKLLCSYIGELDEIQT